MILDSPKKHLTEQELYTYLRFHDHLFNDVSQTFALWELRIGEDEMGNIYNRILLQGQVVDLKVTIDKEYPFDVELKKAHEEANKKPENDKRELKTILNKVSEAETVTISDISSISWIWYEIYNHIRFTPSEYNVPELEDVFSSEIDKYLDNFINDQLEITRKNYYKFETQKAVLINLIEKDKKIQKYGSNFVISQEINDDGIVKASSDFALIHTVYALQKMGYLTVVDMWQDFKYPEQKSFNFDKDRKRFLNITVKLNQSFMDEINEKYQEDNPEVYYEGYDKRKKILKFAGKDITLAKKGKKTDAIKLLESLLKDPQQKLWEDEILEDWGYKDFDETSKNKVYFGKRSLNKIIKDETGISDFIDGNTKEFYINPRYMKIDE